jgi:hypothetical protein
MAHAMAPLDQHEAHFAAVGRLVDTWAHLEFNIDQAIWELAGVDQAFGACITAQLIGVNGRLRALRALLKARGASDKSIGSIGKFAGSLSALQQKRHRAAHDPRMVHLETEFLERLEVTADNSLVFGFQPEDAKTLSATRDEIENKMNQFRELYHRCVLEIGALPDTSRPRLPRITLLPKPGAIPSS